MTITGNGVLCGVTFGERLRKLREAARLTQAGLAEKTGISKRTIESWEQDKRSPVSPDFFKLVEALGASCEDFGGITAAPHAPPAQRLKSGFRVAVTIACE